MSNPCRAEELYQQGLDKANQGDYQGAIAAYNQAIKINPNYLQAYGNRAVARSHLKDNQGAIEDYQKVLQLKPELPQIYYNLGALRSTMGDKPGAIADLEKAAQLFLDQGNQAGYEKVQELLVQLK